MSTSRVRPGQTGPRRDRDRAPGPRRPGEAARRAAHRTGAAVAALLLSTACGTGGAAEGDDPELMTVLLDGPGEEVAEWTGGAADFDDHPHRPDGVEIDVSYPVFEGADRFASRLAEQVDREVRDFRGASRDPVRLAVDWEVVGAGSGVLGVRLVRTEEDLHGRRQGYGTYWYDAETGHTAYSTELLADDDALGRLDGIVHGKLAGNPDVDPEGLHPVMRTYDSMGFNSDGDLLVEFDDGHLSPVVVGHPPSSEPGRIVAVVPSEEAAPLLSDLGERAREASMAEDPVLAVGPPGAVPESLPTAPGVVAAGDPDLDCEAPGTECVALTYDDGPAEGTAALLELLAEEEVAATFFLNGDPALTRPGVLRRAYAEGHELASHNDLHEHMTEYFDDRELPAQVAAVSAMVRRQTGQDVELFRPPFGDTSGPVIEEIGRQGMAQVLWNLDSEDWTGLSPEEIVDGVMDDVEPGSVVLMHDTLAPTLAAAPRLIERLREEGYEFATVSQVVGDPEPGESYPAAGVTVPEYW
ncbi:polysaccharide deacetylase family protein [Nocardiopsis tropica]|uniref:polysaccharide deacetylase family protein n=1 Tax=Nocardiopsis tropica TaxID=109330 RepID=UPI00399D55B0